MGSSVNLTSFVKDDIGLETNIHVPGSISCILNFRFDSFLVCLRTPPPRPIKFLIIIFQKTTVGTPTVAKPKQEMYFSFSYSFC